MNKFDFSHDEYLRFVSRCSFTDEEKEILDLRRKGKSIVEMSMILSMADRTVSRRIDSIKQKILKEIN